MRPALSDEAGTDDGTPDLVARPVVGVERGAARLHGCNRVVEDAVGKPVAVYEGLGRKLLAAPFIEECAAAGELRQHAAAAQRSLRPQYRDLPDRSAQVRGDAEERGTSGRTGA